MHSSTPFYQQLNLRFGVLVSLFILSLAVVCTLLFWQSQQLNQIVEQDLPKVVTLTEQRQALYQTQKFVQQLGNSKTAGELQQYYQALINQQTVLAQLPAISRQLIKELAAVQTQDITIKRLAVNEERNALLKESALIQLQLVLDELQTSQQALKNEQDKLYQQLFKDKQTDRVTTARLKAYLSLAQQSDSLVQTRMAVEQVIALFYRVSLDYPLVEFDAINQQLADALALWQPEFEQFAQASNSDKQRLTNLMALQELLYLEQSTMAKWRGHIRIAQEFIASLEPVSLKLEQALNQPASIQLPQNTLLTQLNSQLPKNIQLSLQQVQWSILALVGLCLLCFIMVLINIRQRVKHYDENTLLLVKQQLADQDGVAHSLIQQKLVQLLSQLIKPKYNEQDFLALEQVKESRETLLFEQAGILMFADGDEKNSQWHALLFGDTEVDKSWRHAFSLAEARQLLAAAKQTKASGDIMRQAVVTLGGQALLFTISYQEDRYFVIVEKDDRYYQLSQELEQLQQQFSDQQSLQQTQLTRYGEQMSQMIIRTMLQNQSIAVGSGEPSAKIARQLQRMLDWCHQLDARQQIRQSVSNVLLLEELLTASYNIGQNASWQRNKVLFIQDPLLLEHGQLALSAFHQLIVRIAGLCLQDKFNATLLIKASLADKNAGQQIVHLLFELQTTQADSTLPDSVKSLVDLTTNAQTGSLLQQYLARLLTVNHVDNVQITEGEGKCTVSLALPVALAENRPVATCDVDLKEGHFMVLSTEQPQVEQLKQVVTGANGKVEQIETFEHLKKLLTTKYLNRYRVAALIITSEVAQQHYGELIAHLTTLAKPIRPKVMVLQTQFHAKLHQLGLFEHSEFDARNEHFAAKLQQFIQGPQAQNLLVSAEVFKQYQYHHSQVDVLLATEHPGQMMVLSRILQWLGLQVHMVADQASMLALWKSGRYLLLFNQFDCHPLVDLEVGKKVARGVFTLPRKGQSSAQLTKVPKEFSHWQLAVIDNILDIDHLMTLLSPWLTTGYREVKSAEKQKVIARSGEKSKDKAVSKPATRTKAATNDDHLIEQEGAFNLALYVQHQGSPELAVFMLDDYIEEINQAIKQLEHSVAEKNMTQAKQANSQLLKIARILGAPEIIALSEQINQALVKKSFVKPVKLLALLKQAGQRLDDFAQAI